MHAVLDRLGAFLPQLAAANAELEQKMQGRDPAEFDVEVVEGAGTSEQQLLLVASHCIAK